MTTKNENTPAAGQGNEGNEQIRETNSADDLTLLRMHRRGDDTRNYYGCWNGQRVPQRFWLPVLIPLEAARIAYRDGSVTVTLSREDAEAHGEYIRHARRQEEIDRRVRERIGELEDTIRAEVTAELAAENREGNR